MAETPSAPMEAIPFLTDSPIAEEIEVVESLPSPPPAKKKKLTPEEK